MKEVVKRWIKKAENDLKSAQLLFDAEEKRLTDIICFHAQQAVEKALKAYLSSVSVRAGKTHDIATLLALCMDTDEEFKILPVEKLERLTFYAVEVRYPDEFYQPSVEESKEAIKIAEDVINFIKKKTRYHD